MCTIIRYDNNIFIIFMFNFEEINKLFPIISQNRRVSNMAAYTQWKRKSVSVKRRQRQTRYIIKLYYRYSNDGHKIKTVLQYEYHNRRTYYCGGPENYVCVAHLRKAWWLTYLWHTAYTIMQQNFIQTSGKFFRPKMFNGQC